MVPVATLWLPILVSAVIIFIVSSLLHTVVQHHWNDFGAYPQPQPLIELLRSQHLAPGDYMAPKAATPAAMRSDEMREHYRRGPMVLLTVSGPGLGMGKSLLQWFAYVLVVAACCAYIGGRELKVGAAYLPVFRITGFAAFAAFALALPQASIWYRRSWRLTLTTMFDGLVYALLVGGTFGWLWPR